MTKRPLAALALALASLTPAVARAQWQQPQPAPPLGAPPLGAPPPFGAPPPQPQQAAAPAPPEVAPGVRETEALLDQAKLEDSGRQLEWGWIDVQAGFEQIGLATFKGDRSLTGGFVPTSASGGVVSVGAGARLLFLTLLGRGRVGFSSLGQLYEVGVEAGFHVPLGRVEPHVQLGAGYAQAGQLRDDVSGAAASAIALRGFYVRAGGGVDVFVLPVLSIGLDVSAELLGMSRGALAASDLAKLKSATATQGSADALGASASGVGGTFSATAVVGLHF